MEIFFSHCNFKYILAIFLLWGRINPCDLDTPLARLERYEGVWYTRVFRNLEGETDIFLIN